MKLPPASDIIVLGNMHSENIILHASIRLSTDRSSVFFDDRELASDNLQCKCSFYCIE